jgi:hypothetical protein
VYGLSIVLRWLSVIVRLRRRQYMCIPVPYTLHISFDTHFQTVAARPSIVRGPPSPGRPVVVIVVVDGYCPLVAAHKRTAFPRRCHGLDLRPSVRRSIRRRFKRDFVATKKNRRVYNA